MGEYTQALQGGILIGLATWVLLAGTGRIGAVSVITAGVLTTRAQSSPWRWAFLAGLAGGGALFTYVLGVPRIELRSAAMLVPAGLLVGFGTVLGSGCTSGHGVCGLGRRSKRSLAAVLVTSHLPPAKWWVTLVFEGLEWLLRK